MKRSALVAEALVFALSVVVAAAVPAETGSITLGSGTGSPGGVVRLPIYLTLSRDQQLERIIAIVDHPSTLTYKEATVSKEGLANGAEIEVKEPAPPAGAKMKRVEITLKGGKGKPLQNGLIAFVSFAVDGKTRPQMMPLPIVEVKGFSISSGALLVKLRGDSGGVTIYEAGMEPQPSLTCFFFTH